MRGKNSGRYTPSRGAEVEEDDSNRWLGTYGDAVTLLMAFFVMLYAMSEVDAQKFTDFVRGLEGPFGNAAVTESILPSNTGIVGPNTPSTAVPEVPSLADTTPVSEAIVTTGDGGLSEGQVDQLDAVRDQVQEALAAVDLEIADYRITSRGLVISIASDDVLFASGSTVVTDTGAGVIGTLADALSRFDNDVVVEGHTDPEPIGRGDYSNWNLSTDRAIAVVDRFITVHGLAASRLGAAGYADQRPVAPNDTPTNRARNRRVDVLVVAVEDQLAAASVEQGPNDG